VTAGLSERGLALFALRATIQSTEDPDRRDVLEEILLLADLGMVRVSLWDGELTFSPGPTLLDGGPVVEPTWN
jgi:hypothetical protein